MSLAPPVFALAAGIQSYDWGKKGSSSKAAQYAYGAALPGFEIDEQKPYAELWMGTHTTLPSKVNLNSENLSSYIKAHPHLIGGNVLNKFGSASAGNLPFLFKILAIQKALSIQAHPDKTLAEELHRKRPDLYKDDNHKPEMAIALTDFRALCGFRPLQEIGIYLTHVRELAALIPPMILARFTTVVNSTTPQGPTERAILKEVWSALMTSEPTQYQAELGKLVERYKSGNVTTEESEVKELVLTIEEQFPGDIGVFCVFMLNVIDLKPGEAIFLGAGEPHAYISGDIVETMATSDNVLRAGLTPKMRDVPNLVGSLTYQSSPGSKHAVVSTSFAGSSNKTQLYDPPIPEFSVLRTSLGAGDSEKHRAIDGPSIAIVTKGGGSVGWGKDEINTKEGTVFFIGAGTGVEFRTAEGAGMEVYRAYVEAN